MCLKMESCQKLVLQKHNKCNLPKSASSLQHLNLEECHDEGGSMGLVQMGKADWLMTDEWDKTAFHGGMHIVYFYNHVANGHESNWLTMGGVAMDMGQVARYRGLKEYREWSQ